MKQLVYVSPLAEHCRSYIDLRRRVGYELRTQVYILRKFDRVLVQEMTTPGPVTRAMVEKFLGSLSGLRPITRRMQLSVVRQFLRYVQQFEPETYVPGRHLEPARSAPRAPYIYTDDEIRRLLKAALRFPNRYTVRRWVLYPTLIAFLYATGMRISEALALNLRDLDMRRGVVTIRKTKFHKSRLVPLMPSTCKALRQYLVARAERGHPTSPESPLFVKSYKLGRLCQSTASHAFRLIARDAGLPHSAGRNPRVHDLRHTAATMRLYHWYRDGKDVQALLPVLVTYLGHSAVWCTEVYLTATAELLEEASIRYESRFCLDNTKTEEGQ